MWIRIDQLAASFTTHNEKLNQREDEQVIKSEAIKESLLRGTNMHAAYSNIICYQTKTIEQQNVLITLLSAEKKAVCPICTQLFLLNNLGRVKLKLEGIPGMA